MPAVILLKGAIDLVFAKEELAESGGKGKIKYLRMEGGIVNIHVLEERFNHFHLGIC